MDTGKTRYMVEWVLDTEAHSPQDAVRIAIAELRNSLADPINRKTSFVVSEADNQDDITVIPTSDIADDIEEVDVWAAFQKKT